MKQRTEPRKLDYNDRAQMLAADLAAAGMATDYIVAKTGLTQGQIQYRKKHWAIKTADFRSGRSRYTDVAVKAVLRVTHSLLLNDLRDYGKIRIHVNGPTMELKP